MKRASASVRSSVSLVVLGLLLWVTTAARAGSLIDLQQLLDETESGATLQLPPGHYGAAVIKQPLVLRGSGAGTVIDGGGSGHALAVQAANVTIRNLAITGSGTDVSRKESGVWIGKQAANAHLDSVHVEGCGFGIWVDAAQSPQITACHIVGQQDARIISDLGNGIHLFNVTDAYVSGNHIEDGRDGIYISNSSGCLLENNHIDRARFAIHYMYAHGNKVIGNVTDSSSVGIALMYSKGIQVLDNRVRSGHTHGILLRNLYYSRIEGNEVSTSQDGLFFSGCSFDTLANNLVTANDIGIQLSDSPDNEVHGNAFVDNVQQLSYQDFSTLVWEGAGGGNFWSDYIGWDRDGDGIGDKAHFPSDVAAYLVQRFPAVRLVMHSPAMVLLQGLESKFPVLRPPGLWDLKPLMTNPLSSGS
jgi:nitrous oxidase accessory protein